MNKGYKSAKFSSMIKNFDCLLAFEKVEYDLDNRIFRKRSKILKLFDIDIELRLLNEISWTSKIINIMKMVKSIKQFLPNF